MRIIATTNRDLRACVSDGKFREDLYYRLSVFPLGLPPLRERRGDVLPLAELFLNDSCAGKRPVPKMSEAATELLLDYEFPGNVRELQNLVQRAVILCNGSEIEPSHLCFEAPLRRDESSDSNETHEAQSSDSDLQSGLQDAEGQLIVDALRSVGGSRKKAAESLGISPRTLRYKIARLRDAGVQIPERC